MQLPKKDWKKTKRKNMREPVQGYDHESTLQGLVDNYMEYKPKLQYFHIPDELYTLIYSSMVQDILNSIIYGKSVSPATAKICLTMLYGVRHALSDAFLGMPDCNWILPIGDKFNLSFNGELKSKTGKRRNGQKNWAKLANVKVYRTFEAVENDLKLFEKFAEHLNEKIE